MGGEHGPLDIARFPTVGKTVVYSTADGIRAFDDATATPLGFADFLAKRQGQA